MSKSTERVYADVGRNMMPKALRALPILSKSKPLQYKAVKDIVTDEDGVKKINFESDKPLFMLTPGAPLMLSNDMFVPENPFYNTSGGSPFAGGTNYKFLRTDLVLQMRAPVDSPMVKALLREEECRRNELGEALGVDPATLVLDSNVRYDAKPGSKWLTIRGRVMGHRGSVASYTGEPLAKNPKVSVVKNLRFWPSKSMIKAANTQFMIKNPWDTEEEPTTDFEGRYLGPFEVQSCDRVSLVTAFKDAIKLWNGQWAIPLYVVFASFTQITNCSDATKDALLMERENFTAKTRTQDAYVSEKKKDVSRKLNPFFEAVSRQLTAEEADGLESSDESYEGIGGSRVEEEVLTEPEDDANATEPEDVVPVKTAVKLVAGAATPDRKPKVSSTPGSALRRTETTVVQVVEEKPAAGSGIKRKQLTKHFSMASESAASTSGSPARPPKKARKDADNANA